MGDRDSNVKLLGSCLSPFASRVRIALHLKSVSHEFIEENLLEPKSQLLLRSNPLYKKIPVLIHGANPICESLIILQYIDEVWPHAPAILPSDAVDRAESKFWAFYVDDKLVPALIAVLIGESDVAKKAAVAILEEGVVLLEGALRKLSKGKAFFGGDNIGFLDIVLGPISVLIGLSERFTGVELLTEAETPSLLRWTHDLSSYAAVKGLLPEPEKFAEFSVKLRPILRARFAHK
ncbi:hypothetical protein V6N13_004134 [Hibiscus sabdariffa]|uniref:Glutathione S-transferase n=1 Tax=Hibiscus sabdariffa TaxID=183260 RepID=A0ABR2RYG4_9ROSI